MKIDVISAEHLDAELIDAWNAVQQSNPILDSPFFSAAFSRAVAQERRGIEIAIVERGNEVVGLLPYCREKARLGGPVAGAFTDFQGMILKPEAAIDPTATAPRMPASFLALQSLDCRPDRVRPLPLGTLGITLHGSLERVRGIPRRTPTSRQR